MKKILILSFISAVLTHSVYSQWIKQNIPLKKNLHYIDFVTPDYGWVGGPYSLFQTTNGGVEWKTLINKTALDTLIEGFVFIDKSNGWMNIYEDNNHISKIYKTTDGGDNWHLQYTSPPSSYIKNIRFIDMNNGFLLLWNYYNYLIKTTDGGATWHSHLIDTLDTSTLNKIFFLNSQTGWAAGEKLFKTTDGGINWTFLEDKYIGRDMRDIQFINPDTGWYSDLTGVYKTTDGGQNWYNQLSEYGEYDASAIFFTDKNNGWFCRYITLYHTSDGGLTWKTQLNFDSLGIKDVYFTDQDSGWVVGNGGIIFRTVNGGLPVELTSFSASIQFNSTLLKWSTATEINNRGFEIQKCRSFDKKGYNWITIGFVAGNGTTTEKNNYYFLDKKTLPGENLYRLKQIDYDGHFEYSKEISVELNQPLKINLSQNYPNPFNPVTRIKYYIPVNTFVTLKIYDSMGNEIKKLVSGTKNAGKYSVTWNGTNDKNEKVSSGIYFYKLGTIENQIIRKMIFLK